MRQRHIATGTATERGEELGASLQSITLLDQQLVSYGPQAEAGPPPAFVNQVLLERSHAHSFMSCLWLLPHYNGRAK